MKLRSCEFHNFVSWYGHADVAWQKTSYAFSSPISYQPIAPGDSIILPRVLGFDNCVGGQNPSGTAAIKARLVAWAGCDAVTNGDPSGLPSFMVLTERAIPPFAVNGLKHDSYWLTSAEIQKLAQFSVWNQTKTLYGIEFYMQFASSDGVTVPIIYSSKMIVGD